MKLVIIGNGGTGKSTLAAKIGKELDIPVVHVDLLMWTKDWDRIPEKVFAQKIKAAMSSPHWIIEGWGYHSTLYERIEKADVVIYLQYPLEFCLKSVRKRNLEYNNKKNPYDPFEDDRVGNQYLYDEAIQTMHEAYEPELRRWLQQWEYSLKKILVFHSREALEKNYYDVIQQIKSHPSYKTNQNNG